MPLDDVAEVEDELVESVRADEARFRAFRCFFVIEAFAAQQKVLPYMCTHVVSAPLFLVEGQPRDD